MGEEEARERFGFLLEAARIRNSSSWWDCLWIRPTHHDPQPFRVHTRCDCLSEDAEGHLFNDRCPFKSGFKQLDESGLKVKDIKV